MYIEDLKKDFYNVLIGKASYFIIFLTFTIISLTELKLCFRILLWYVKCKCQVLFQNAYLLELNLDTLPH
jgi:hypothetical protein